MEILEDASFLRLKNLSVAYSLPEAWMGKTKFFTAARIYAQGHYEALENVGFGSDRLALINARDAKAAVGRKTDRKDASRLAELARSGHFRRSFVPPKDFRIQRFISREYQKIKSELSVAKNRHQKLLNSTGCRASIVFSDVHGKAASAILDESSRPSQGIFIKTALFL